MWRRPAELLILLTIAFLVMRTWLLDGTTVAIRVAGPSMAAAYEGPHFAVVCDDCGLRFACDATAQRRPSRAVCPNCGYRDNAIRPLDERPGNRLLVDKLSYQLRAPRRWEPVIFRCPQQRSAYCLKRVVGLPGEHVRICNGDVYVDGRLAQKTLEQLRQMAIPVHDTRFHPRQAQQAPRWRTKRKPTGWTAESTGFRFSPPPVVAAAADLSADELPIDWLCYHHGRRGHAGTGTLHAPITDDYAYNQTVSRELNAVRDLLLVARLKAGGPGRLAFAATAGRDRFIVHLWPAAGKGTLYRNESQPREFTLPRSLSERTALVEIAAFDGRLMLAIDGRELVTSPENTSSSPSPDDSSRPPGSSAKCPANPEDGLTGEAPLAIGAAGLDVIVQNLRVFRDVLYTEVRGPADSVISTDGIRLGDGEYFVLGDNSPVSQDSRYMVPGSLLTDEFLLGRVLRWPR